MGVVSGSERQYIPEAVELCFARMTHTPVIYSTPGNCLFLPSDSLFLSDSEDAGTYSIIRLSAKLVLQL